MSDNAEEKAAAPATASTTPGEGRARRDRKQAEFFSPEVKQKEEFVIKQGHGTKLGDIPNAHFKILKLKADDDAIVDLHKMLFGRPGTANKRKKDIFEFSGFVWEGDEEKEKLKERASRYTLAAITVMCDIFEIAKDGKKEDKIARLVDFLESPKSLGSKDLAALDAKKREQKKRQRERKSKAKGSASKTPKGKKSKKAEDGDEDEGDDESEEEKDEEEEEEEVVVEEKKPKAKRAKKAAKETKASEEEAEEAAEPAEEPEAAEPTEEPEAAEPTEEPEAAAADESSEKEQQGKPTATPTDDQLKEAVRGIVAGVDALSFSFKNLMKELTGKFPDAQFSSARKKWIKNFLVEVITPAADETADDAMKVDTADAASAQTEATEAAEVTEAKTEVAEAE